MDVLMACAELLPIATSSAIGVAKAAPACREPIAPAELGDVVASLAKTLCRLDHKVTVAIPRYKMLDDAGLMLARRLTPIRLAIPAGPPVEAVLYDARLGSGVELMAIDIPGLYDRPGIYGEDGVAYPDNARRFGLFCRALAQVVTRRQQQGQGFGVVHAHDWPAALLPFLLRAEDIRTVLTVHDVRGQGQYAKGAMDEIGLSWDDFHPAGLEFYDQLNMLKAGVLTASVVTTVSPTYARALVRPEGGAGLDGVFRAREADVKGIVHGVDYARFNPATDAQIPARYDAEDLGNKGRCKATLLHRLELGLEPAQPLIVALGPVTAAEGFDLLIDAIDAFATSGAQLVVAGGGDPGLCDALRSAAAELADVRYLPELTELLRHQLLAAADIVVCAAGHAPDGQLPRLAQRYGAVPIARAIDGIVDSVVDCDARCETGTGFVFQDGTAEALVAATQRALTAARTPSWGRLRRRVMQLDLSWERPAHRYAQLYRAPVAG